jgi:hypothetical protein
MWELQHATDRRTAADWGITLASINLVSQGIDALTLETDQPLDAEPLWPHGDLITIYRDDVRWFTGRVEIIDRAGELTAETISYTIHGPWWYLDNKLYRESWRYATSATATTSTLTTRALLGQQQDGTPIRTTAVIAAAIQQAIDSGAPITLGTIDEGTLAPSEEIEDLTIGEVIRRMLRWNPDYVTWFDYATAAPTLHIRARQNLAPASLTLGDKITTLGIRRRYDLTTPGVRINYERTDDYDGSQYRVITIDEAGSPDAFGGVEMTVELQGSSETTQSAKVTTATIAPGDLAWWRKHHPALNDSRISDRSIVDGSTAILDEDGNAAPSGLSRELIDGILPEWTGRTAAPVTVRAKLNYTFTEGNLILRREEELISVRLTATNAVSTTYTRVASSSPAESPPAGLAARLLAALNQPHYEGQIVIEEAEAGGTPWHARTINLLDGRAEWTTMAAPVQSVAIDLPTGRTTITIAPLAVQSITDLVALFRMNRRRRHQGTGYRDQVNPTNSRVEAGGRTEAQNSSPEGTSKTELESGDLTSENPAEIAWRKVQAYDASGSPRTFLIQSADIAEGDIRSGGHPWEVRLVQAEPEGPTLVRIAAISYLFNPHPARTVRAISNYDPGVFTPGDLAIATTEGNTIGIELTLNSSGAVTAAEIVSTDLSGYEANQYYRLTGSAPIYVDRVLIPLAILGDGLSGAHVQLARTHLRLTTWVHNGYLYTTAIPA